MPRVLDRFTDRSELDVQGIALDHMHAVRAVLRRVDLDAIERIVDRLRFARDNASTVFVATK